MDKPTRVYVEGIIGAGKSTLLDDLKLKYQDQISIHKEPIDEWINIGLFKKYRSDPVRWGYSFQSYVAFDRIIRVIDSDAGKISYIERSPISDKIFMKLMVNDHELSDMEVNMYNRNINKLIVDYGVFDTKKYNIASIFLDIDIETCMNQMMIRDRKDELNIKKSYFKELRKSHMTTGLQHMKRITNHILIIKTCPISKRAMFINKYKSYTMNYIFVDKIPDRIYEKKKYDKFLNNIHTHILNINK